MLAVKRRNAGSIIDELLKKLIHVVNNSSRVLYQASYFCCGLVLPLNAGD